MKKRNVLMSIVLLASILFTTVVYSAFNTQLQIEGEAIVRLNQDIRITDISITSKENNAYEQYNSKYGKDTTSVYVVLPESSSITYEVEITNKASYSYLIESIEEISNTNSNIDVEISLKENDIVESNNTKVFTIELTNNTGLEQKETLVYKYGFKKNKFTVSFDANGGSVSTLSKEVSYGSTYGDLPTPTREGYKFLGWNGKNIFNIDNIKEKKLTSIDGNSIIFDGSSVENNTSNAIRFQKYLNGVYVSTVCAYDFSSSNVCTFTKDSSFDSILMKENTSKWDPYFFMNDIYMEDGKIYTISYELDSYDALNARATVSNIQFEEGDTATTYESYYLKSSTTVTQTKNHTLKAIWQDNVAPTLSLSKETYIEDNFSGWDLNNAYVDLEGSLVMGENGKDARVLAGVYNVNGDFWYPMFDAYSNNTTVRGVNWGSEYYDDNMNSAYSLEGYRSNGWAQGGLPLNQWANNITWQNNNYNSKTSWSAISYPRYGPNVKYVILSFSVGVNNGYSKPMTKIRNFKIYGEAIPNSFYNIKIDSSDNVGVVTTKYTKGSQTIDYFKTGGTMVVNNQIRVTENGVYTVYVEDDVGNSTIKTIEITNIK